MQRMEMIESLRATQEEMRHLSLKWAKIKEKRYDLQFSSLDELTDEELVTRFARINGIYQSEWAALMKVWKRLPEAQWDTTFLLGMRHLPEYTDLRSALAEFKEKFVGKKANAKNPARID